MKLTARTPGIVISRICFSWRPWRPGVSESYLFCWRFLGFQFLRRPAEMVIERPAQRRLEVGHGLPAQVFLGVTDRRHARQDVLITLAVIIARAYRNQAGLFRQRSI